jgi:hypothetical protein
MYVALVLSVLAAAYIIFRLVSMRRREHAGQFPKPLRRSRVPEQPKEVVNPEFRFDDPQPGESR